MEPEEALAALQRMGEGPDDAIELLEAALLLAARDRPHVALDRYRAYIDEISGLLKDRLDAGTDEPVTALIRTLADDHGYRGDQRTYDDPQNANMIRVIDRRRGLPVALGILYIGVARRAGLAASGLNFPSHFLVSVDSAGTRHVLDPFYHGRRLEAGQMRDIVRKVAQLPDLRPEFYAPVDDRAVLLRLQNNAKIRAVQNGQMKRAAQVLEAMVALAPNHGESWRELGLLRAQAGELRGGVEALERSLALPGDEGERHRTAILLQQLRSSMN